MSKPAPPPSTRDEMIRVVCEATSRYGSRCLCIDGQRPPCMGMGGLADDILRWREAWRSEAFRDGSQRGYKQGCAAVREVIGPALESYERMLLQLQRELTALRGRIGGER